MIKSQYAMIVEHFREGTRGKVDLLGQFDRIFAQQIPAAHQQLVFVALLVTDAEADLGRHQMQFRCVRPTQQPLFEQQGALDFKPMGGSWLSTVRVVFQLQGFPLPDWGKYVFTLLVDGIEVASHPLTVVREEQAPGGRVPRK
jgi:hypothetical protein